MSRMVDPIKCEYERRVNESLTESQIAEVWDIPPVPREVWEELARWERIQNGILNSTLDCIAFAQRRREPEFMLGLA
jgi:hypothetical protein